MLFTEYDILCNGNIEKSYPISKKIVEMAPFPQVLLSPSLTRFRGDNIR